MWQLVKSELKYNVYTLSLLALIMVLYSIFSLLNFQINHEENLNKELVFCKKDYTIPNMEMFYSLWDIISEFVSAVWNSHGLACVCVVVSSILGIE